MKTIILSTKTFGKAAKKEVLNLLPETKSIKKVHVPSVGYTYFFKDLAGNIIGKVFMERGQSQLIIN